MRFLFLFLILLASRASAGEVVVLSLDLVVGGRDHVDLPPVTVETSRTQRRHSYGLYWDFWSSKVYLCRIHLREGVDRLDKGTVIVLDGRREVERTPHGMYAHKFFVSEPEDIEYICCGVYVDQYESFLGVTDRLTGRSFPEDFR